MEKNAAKNVPGRNAMVMMAMVFIEDPSRRIAVASSMLASASSCVSKAKSWHRK